MKGCFVFILIVLGVLGIPFIGSGLESHDVIEQNSTGQINWTNGFISAKGKAGPDEKDLDPPQAQQSALNAAIGVARENLLQLIKGIRIDSNTKVGDILVGSETVRSKLKEILDTLKPIGTINHLPDEVVEVTLQMSIKGAFAQLILPADIKQIKPIKQVNPVKSDANAKTDKNSQALAATPTRLKSIVHTGMIVDTKGLSDVRPVIVPKIVDESGQEIYGPAFVSREYAIQSGMSGYTRTLESAKNDLRIKDNPLIVKGLKTKSSGRSVIVVSNSDASKLRKASEHLSFLRQCGVIIVLD